MLDSPPADQIADLIQRDDAVVLCCGAAVALHVDAFVERARAAGVTEHEIAGMLGDALTSGLTDELLEPRPARGRLAAIAHRLLRSARRTPRSP